jgi:hypothetical protein
MPVVRTGLQTNHVRFALASGDADICAGEEMGLSPMGWPSNPYA